MGNCLAGEEKRVRNPDQGTGDPIASTTKTITTLEISGNLNAEIAAVLCDLLPTWKCPSARDIDVTIISGGISNALYRVSLRRVLASPFDAASFSSRTAVNEPVVVLRVYGENTEKFVDRETEVKTMRVLHRHGFGPEVLGVFGNGRVESFLSGKVCLEPGDLGREDVAVTIAETLARFHLISSGKGGAPRTPHGFPVPRPSATKMDTPFRKTRSWLETAKTLESSYDKKQLKIFKELDVAAILEELGKLETKATALRSPMAFTHNDLLSGNIMVRRTSEGIESMTFIDFEYADWAPRGFDLGNHFCEYAGFDCDYSKYPDESHTFVRAYLRVFDGAEPSQRRVKQVVREANLFALAAHLYWAAWSMLQAKWSSIDFDYMAYAKLRVDEYYKRRSDFLVTM